MMECIPQHDSYPSVHVDVSSHLVAKGYKHIVGNSHVQQAVQLVYKDPIQFCHHFCIEIIMNLVLMDYHKYPQRPANHMLSFMSGQIPIQ